MSNLISSSNWLKKQIINPAFFKLPALAIGTQLNQQEMAGYPHFLSGNRL
ncbi:MAG: hypothetical protein H6Q20_2251 [Bacteroidetes bacterium]|jgi:hypothetical protein|nr:hypothetical protein [Bacteroidota bacterium]